MIVMYRISATLLIVSALILACESGVRGDETAGGGDSLGVMSIADPLEASSYADTLDAAVDGGTVLLPGVRQKILIEEDSLWAEALRVHYNAIVLDGHIDTPSLMVDEAYALGNRNRALAGHVDLPRMFDGGLDAAFFAIYVPVSLGESAGAVRRARRMIDEVERQVAALSDSMGMAYSADDVRLLTRSGRKAVLLGLEGGHALMASPDTLQALYDEGVRYVTLTHVNSHSWAESSQSPPRFGGLNDLGRRMVRKMNELGMIVDLSHVSDSTFYDALQVSNAPVMLSHSSARALVDNVRNVDDDMLLALAENGGIIMINFFDPVVNSALSDSFMDAVYKRMGGRSGSLNTIWNVIYEMKAEQGLPGASLEDVVDHIDHAVRVAGIDHVGLGSDFDGVFDLPAGLQDVTRLPWITYELMKRGFSEEDLYKILGGNALRVMEEVESAATR
jgi:membrane dipeptidase